MYAVIETGGKQYKVTKGDVVDLERLEGDDGSKLKFDKVLCVGGEASLKLGHPYVEGAVVEGKISRQFRGKKVIVYKKKRRKGYEVRNGHRQELTKVEITNVQG